MDRDTSVKVAVRIRPLSPEEIQHEPILCINTNPEDSQIVAGNDTYFTFDYVFGAETVQSNLYENCVTDLVNAFFEGFNATILAYGQTGSGKTWTMGSSSDMNMTMETIGIIPRMIKNLFEEVHKREKEDPSSTYKIHVQFLEIYGEDIRDLLDQTKTSNVTIRETREDGVFVSGAREELVLSYEQMMKSLEDGTRHRTTASTRMNLTSSRSHAIFTVILEHTIYDGSTNADSSADGTIEAAPAGGAAQSEVRRSKFHFVDLAGSERAKRSGAQGQQLKEGIDINRGLLALGNVISALGDDTKRGKVFVPYRDSKLTRMLQDSLGGNSKTLMICCVSPSSLNFNESVNALRYANRARNIKNKPIVNRDPTLVMIDELKHQLKSISSELLEMRRRKEYVEVENPVPIQMLENWAYAQIKGLVAPQLQTAAGSTPAKGGRSSFGGSGGARGGSGSLNSPNAYGSYAHSSSSSSSSSSSRATGLANGAGGRSVAEEEYVQKELASLRLRVRESDDEVQRLTSLLKQARSQMSEKGESLILASSERDYYKMKWAEAAPEEAQKLGAFDVNPSSDSSISSSSNIEGSAEKKKMMDIVGGHLREIESLRQELVDEKARNANLTTLVNNDKQSDAGMMDAEFTNSITTLLNQTREELRQESQRLKGLDDDSAIDGAAGRGKGSGGEEGLLVGSDDDDADVDGSGYNGQKSSSYEEDEVEQQAYLKRQQLLSTEVEELGQSIALKEQLMKQLTRSQQQYGAMKAFYEQKLSLLSDEMKQKQDERDRLERELQEVAEEKTEALVQKEARERRLRDELRRKDEELKSMKKKQDELNRLSQMQTRYSTHLSKLESDIISMKKQRVDLTKTLNSEKKGHLVALANKAREIERLKRELVKSANEVRRLGRDKELAESKAKDAMREGVVLKKKTQELMKASGQNYSLSSARSAYRAVNKMSRISSNLSGATRILTEEELRTKRWIDKRIEEISNREAAAEALKAQYEHQLELLNRKESLEQERYKALEKSSDPNDNNEAKTTAAPAAASAALLLNNDEKEKLLEIEDQLTKIDGELDERHLQISTIAQEIANSGDVAGSDKTMEVLKRTAAGSLPAAHELIRLLFDMLVMSSRSYQFRWDELAELRDREEALKQEIDELVERIASDKRAHDLELTRSAHEYEEKLQDLFEQIAVSNFRLFEKGDDQIQDLTGGSSMSIDGNGTGNGLGIAEAAERTGTSSSRSASSEKAEPMRLQLAVSTEECKFLRGQLAREGTRLTQLQVKYEELEREKNRSMREAKDKSDQIRFLEEDRSLFKTLADDLKAGLNSLGKPGKTILDSIKDRHHNANVKSKRGLFAEYTSLSDNEDDDTESVLGEFDFLAEEIFRTGGITASQQQDRSAVGTPGSANSSSTAGAAASASVPSRSIYDRLTNPSNFTGYMKNVFENDLEHKRKKVQQLKDKNNPQQARRPSTDPVANSSNNSSSSSSYNYRSIDTPSGSSSSTTGRRNPETQKFFNEYYDRNHNNSNSGHNTPTQLSNSYTANNSNGGPSTRNLSSDSSDPVTGGGEGGGVGEDTGDSFQNIPIISVSSSSGGGGDESNSNSPSSSAEIRRRTGNSSPANAFERNASPDGRILRRTSSGGVSKETSAYPPRPPSGSATNPNNNAASNSPMEWSISSDPWR